MASKVNINRAKEIMEQVFVHGLETGERIPVMLWGPAGVGKSDAVFQVAADLPGEFGSYGVEDVRLSSLNPIDVRGLPYRDGDTVKFSRPYFFPKEEDKRIIFLDELNTAPVSTQVTAYEMARNFSVGGTKFPKHTLIAMAGNRAKDKGATFAMPKPLENRLLHIEVIYDLKAFVQWGIKNSMNDDILAFLQFRPDLLGPDTPPETSAFPTPRTWAYLNSIMSANIRRQRGTSEEITEGLIGSGAATEFFAFLRLKDALPNIDNLLNNGYDGWTSGKKDIMFAFTAALASAIKRDPTSGDRIKNFSKAFMSLPDEFQIICFWMMREIPNISAFLREPGVMERVQNFAK